MRLHLLLSFLFISLYSFSQTGTVSGVILDKEYNNEPLPFANVLIKGTTIGTSTDDLGKYSLSVKPGSYVLEIGYLGYETKEITFTIKAGEKKVINHTLEASGVQLDDIVVTHSVLKEKESVLLQEQQKAVEITQVIGAQELSRKGVSNAEAAVTKTSGVAKQQGAKNVFVRGLGDRYNSTSLNGLALPSDDPEYKNISLDFFGTEVIQNVGINKVFSSSLLGDVGGANINIISKELGSGNELEIGVSSGFNTQTIGKQFFLIDGNNWFGTQRTESNISNLNNYTFRNNLKPKEQNLQLNGGFSISGGKKFHIGEKNSLSLYLVGSFDNSYLFSEGNIKQTNSIGSIYQDQKFEKYNYNVSQLLMNNMKYKFGDGHSLSLNNILIHNNNQTYGTYFGINNPEQAGDIEYLVRQQTNDNLLFVNQLLANIKISEKLKYNAGLAFNTVTGNEPDRRSNNYLLRDGFYAPQTNSAGENERYFSKLDEKDIVANTSINYDFSKEEKTNLIEIGGDFRLTTRRFDAFTFNHDFSTRIATDINNPDVIFNQNSINNGTFNLITGRGNSNNPRAFDPFYYDANRLIVAGYGKLTYSFNKKLTTVIGVRGEKINQEVEYDTNIASSRNVGPSKLDNTYILPSLAIKYSLSDKNIIRFNASKTYTYPQFKEVAPFKYQDVSFSSQGNPNLIASDNYNFDLKFEKYFGKGEIISLTAFGKIIQNPISRSEIPSAGSTLTYLNVGENATIFGLELELRKNIINDPNDTEAKNALSLGLNASYLNTKVNLDQNSIAQFTNNSSELEGATPLLVNTDLTFNHKFEKSEFSSTIVLNYFSNRVYSIGTRGFENIVEKSIPTLDFVSKIKLNDKFKISLKGSNLLNPNFSLSRDSANNGENIVLKDYKKGINFSIGFGYSF
ncbi:MULTISPECIES: TonB-dependent receptor [Flavobacterium]|uniref:TonB-dependent receptor domain-containing protein n=1 Tax=Flavobacterium jumunjinense TaxID=998845 RepID=A0ABV5GLC5_9FLAO|nr:MULTISPECIES: TonB-dependent receptor [Flavobacterium]